MEKRILKTVNKNLLRFFLISFIIFLIYELFVLLHRHHFVHAYSLENILIIGTIIFTFVALNLNPFLIIIAVVIEILKMFINNNLIEEEVFILIQVCYYGILLFLAFCHSEKIFFPFSKKTVNLFSTLAVIIVVTTILIMVKKTH